MTDSTPQSELYEQINTLFGTLAEAYKLEGETLARALEDGSMQLEMGEDENGNRFVLARHTQADGTEKIARIFKEVIHWEGEKPDEAQG